MMTDDDREWLIHTLGSMITGSRQRWIVLETISSSNTCTRLQRQQHLQFWDILKVGSNHAKFWTFCIKF